MGDLQTLSWPASKVGEAVEALGRRSGLSARALDISVHPESEDRIGPSIEIAASRLGLEAEPVHAFYPEVQELVSRAAPALMQIHGDDGARFLVLLASGPTTVTVLDPNLVPHRVEHEDVRAALCREEESKVAPEIDRLLDEAGTPPRKKPKARKALLRERLRSARPGHCWLLRTAPGGNLWALAREARLLAPAFRLLSAHTFQYCLWILSWWLVGKAALEGVVDRGWLLAWVLLLITLIPLRMLTSWSQGLVSIRAGALLKQRLLYGVLRLDPDEIRHQGVGQFLGRVIESEAVEAMALSGGFLGMVAAIELVMALAVLAVGAAGSLHVLLLIAWTALSFVLGWRYLGHFQRWTASRLEMTHDLIERIVGYRTRLAQEPRWLRHDGEDQALYRYLELSGATDRAATQLTGLVVRGWMVLGVIGLAPAFVSEGARGVLSEGGNQAALAVSLGGILLAYRAFRKLTWGLWHIAGAVVAWKQIAFLFHAAARPESDATSALSLTASRSEGPLLEARGLVFRYPRGSDPVLKGCSLRIDAGDRLLLEGGSGGGKSTFVSLLTGLRNPDSGLLLLSGLDRGSLGSRGWRRRVVAAPQFHENHVFTETMAFNLLMGRGFPPSARDLEEAETVCRELGLGDLLDRMPAGMFQMVGESGWQLSHGERSRLYVARAILQGADLVILDESFAALDPRNLLRAIECALRRAPTLILIAHP